MLLTVSNLLKRAELDAARELIATLAWRDGAETAGRTARAVKQNMQADLSSRTGTALREALHSALRAHPVLMSAAQPKRFSKLLISRTDRGGGYGLHVDNAIMGDGETAIRTDLSFTLFLSAPEDYDGGELAIEHAGLTHSLKGEAGDLVLYPSTSLHQVTDVTSGTRIVCVGWIESRIQRHDDREMLFDLINLRAELAGRFDAQSPEMLTLSKTIENAKRRFS